MPHARPKLAVIVANFITGDSRVQKSALAAARAGWDVTLIGRSPAARVERSWFGPVKVIRVPVGREMADRERRLRDQTRRQRLAAMGYPDQRSIEQYQAAYDARARARRERISRLTAPGSVLPRTALKAWGRLALAEHRARLRLVEQWSQGTPPPTDTVLGDWRRDAPQILDLDLAFGPVIEQLRPDLIHANDITMLYTAASAAGQLRADGHRCRWIYDAHEYVAGVDWPTERMMSAFPAMERELIHRADAVVTVSPEIADIIAEDHKLAEVPSVVRNVPILETVGNSGAPSVREVAGVADDVPLLVYSGYIHAERGIGTAVQALVELEEFHLAIVSGASNPELARILGSAEDLGVRDRVHVVPYVEQHQVPDYLASADLGIICSKRTINYELSLPTKFAEYVHGGLPVICSDVRTLSRWVREHDVGDVFVSEDAASFAETVRRAYPRRAELRANISEQLLDELSWEFQSSVLLEVYRRASGLTPPPPEQPVSWEASERPRLPAKPPRRISKEPTWRPLGATPIKLGMGPANYAGQLGALAEAVTDARSDVSVEVFMHASRKAFGYPADVVVRQQAMRKVRRQLEQTSRILTSYTHLVADAFRPVFGQLNGDSIEYDLPALRQHDIQVALLCHGSDVRSPEAHLARVAHSPYRDAPAEDFDQLSEVSARNRRIAAEAGLPVFVTTPDLLSDVPNATWLPLVVNTRLWAHDRPVMERRRPVVLHAPSKRWTKGTDRFIDVLERMDARQLIELRLVEGLRWRQMLKTVKDADIVIDQLGIGSYGTFACEAMAAGKPVVAYLTKEASTTIGEPCPVINADPASLESVVERLLDDREATAQIGLDSRAYVERFHDGRRSAEVVGTFLRLG